MRFAKLVIVFFAAFLLGEDVEQDAIFLPAPVKPIKKKRAPQAPTSPPPLTRPQEPAFGFPTPQRLDLDLPFGFKLQPERPGPRPEMTEAERVTKRIDGYFTDILARRRARRGNVDPGWRNLEHRMDYFFEPDFSDVRDPRITEVSAPWLVKTVVQFFQGWYKRTQRQNRDAYMRPERIPGDDAYMAGMSLLDVMEDAYSGSDYGTVVTTLVEVRLGTGATREVRLAESSGHPKFDRAAIQAVQKAVQNPFDEEMPPGPARAQYSMSARYTILPPIPVVGFSFDILLGHFDLVYPLKKMVSGQVRLVAVYR